MTRFEAMITYLLACLAAKDSGECVESFLKDAEDYADKHSGFNEPIEIQLDQ